MFLAGVIPGLLAGFMLMVGIYVTAKVQATCRPSPWAGWREILYFGAADSAWGLFLIVIILGGIYGGIFTPTEAAAVAAVYAFLIANFVYKDMGPLEGRRRPSLQVSLSLKNPQSLITVLVHPDTKHSLFEAGQDSPSCCCSSSPTP